MNDCAHPMSHRMPHDRCGKCGMHVWNTERKMAEGDIYPTPPAPTQGEHWCSQCEIVGPPTEGQPADADVLARARALVDAFGPASPRDLIARTRLEFARALLAEVARREAAEQVSALTSMGSDAQIQALEEVTKRAAIAERRAEAAERGRERERAHDAIAIETLRKHRKDLTEKLGAAEQRAEAAEQRLQQAEADLRNIGLRANGMSYHDIDSMVRAALARTTGGEG